ncbi:hypothetical protein [Celeribacter sp.]|uniref:hypothetical protein n=1 Tax=Celeribacter sp. TaxID=1890673 RepID=UPI003A8DC1B2
MTRILATALAISVAACVVLGGVALWLRDRNADLKSDLDQAKASQAAQADVSAFLGNALTQSRVRSSEYAALYKELANVEDDSSCRSPAIDRAFDLLQQRRATR